MMNTINDIVEKIMEETYIVQSSVKAGDIDVALEAIERRDHLIQMLEKLDVPERKALIAEIWPEYRQINDECMEGIKKLKAKTEKEFYKNKGDQHKLVQNRKAHDRYNMNSVSEYGSTFDNKK